MRETTHLPDDVTGLLAAVPGRAAFRAVVRAVRGLPAALPVPGLAAPVPGLTKPVKGLPLADMGRTAGDSPPCSTKRVLTAVQVKRVGWMIAAQDVIEGHAGQICDVGPFQGPSSPWHTGCVLITSKEHSMQ